MVFRALSELIRSDPLAQILCVLGISSIAMFGVMSVDMSFFYSVGSSDIVLNYVVSMVPAFAAVALLTLFDRKYLSENMKQNLLHSEAFVIIIMSIMSVWSYGLYTLVSYHWSPSLYSDLPSIQQMIILRMVLFLIGAPTLAYVLSNLKRRK
jgi:hypothetical protein